MAFQCAAFCVSVLAVIIGSFTVPRAGHRAQHRVDDDHVTVLSFNIRYGDAKEADGNNNWPRRVPRIQRLVGELSPWLVGLQEALAPQIIELQAALPRYAAVGFDGDGHAALALDHSLRRLDFQTAILYDTSRLKLVEQDHIWLSETPHVGGSKSWGSRGARTLTMAAFSSVGSASVDIVIFNTHLDVWSTSARHHQAELMRQRMLAWSNSFPNAAIFATGDFNSANGQRPHAILTQSFEDAWTACARDVSCAGDSYAATFHGWLGTLPNTYAFRGLQFIMFTLHGSGIQFPTQVPRSFWEFMRKSRDVLSQLPEVCRFGLDVPSSLGRFHVDWILFKGAMPQAVFVADVTDIDFSSDHFPVVASFALP